MTLILFLEHKATLPPGKKKKKKKKFFFCANQPEPDSNLPSLRIGSAKVVHEGDQLTVVTYGALVQKMHQCRPKEYAKNRSYC